MNGYVVIGILGTSLDRGEGPGRWALWRPTVSLCQHEDLLIERLELLVDALPSPLADQVIEDIRMVAPEVEIRTHALHFKDPWSFEEVYGGLHDFARNYAFNPDKEQYLFHITTGTHVAQICTFLLTESRHFPGRLIQTAPAGRHQGGAAGRYAIIDLDLSKYDRIAQRFTSERKAAADFLKAGIPTRNAAFNKTIAEIEHVAVHSSAPILLTGPTGAGKSSLARRIHELKHIRRGLPGKFVEVNCATLRGDAAMSALFGHKRGAFTGATADRAGLLREAHEGLLFLDEIGELGTDEQAMLLHAIEEKCFYPLGSDKEVESDFELICGTNRDPHAAVRAGTFREDLLARINTWTFEMPGLSQRREDIEPNIEYELSQITAATGQMYRFNREGLTRFLAFAKSPAAAWSGNFRDLNAAVARMATMAPAGRITLEVVESEIARLQRSWRQDVPGTVGDADDRIAELLGNRMDTLDEFDRVQLSHVIRVCDESPTLSAAGRRLFAISRSRRGVTNDADRLRKYLARFSLDWSAISSSRGPRP